MDKIKSILSSATGRKVGPPVPPRPPPAAVQKALELTRQMSPILGSKISQSSSSNSHGRTIVYNSTAKTSHANTNVGHQQQQQQQITTKNNVSCSAKTIAVTSFDDSSTGRSRGGINKADENGNSVQIAHANCVNSIKMSSNSLPKAAKPSQPLIMHHKSPVPCPRSASNQKVSMTLVKITPMNTDIETPQNLPTNCYSSLLMRNQNSQPIEQRDATNNNCNGNKKPETNRKSCENEMREKLLSEMFGKSSNLVEASNPHIKFRNGSNLKRSSSFDVLNDISADKIDKKVVFQEILLSELSELRRETRLSSAKSSPDISPNGNLTNIFDIDLEKKSLNTFLSLEDSGVEDEGKMDDWSSSGVGDSWDSCKEIENRWERNDKWNWKFSPFWTWNPSSNFQQPESLTNLKLLTRKKTNQQIASNIQPSTNKFASTISLVRMSVSTDPFRSKCGKMMQTAPCCWCVECFSKQEKRRKYLSAPLSEIYHFSLPFFFHRINISLPGLPPLPKSLRVVDPILNQHETTFTSLIGKGANSTLDTQLATLKREMVSFTRTWKKSFTTPHSTLLFN